MFSNIIYLYFLPSDMEEGRVDSTGVEWMNMLIVFYFIIFVSLVLYIYSRNTS
jgi:hypothetical protein